MTHLEIAKLPLQERLQLMESLWDSLCREPSAKAPIPTWHQQVLDGRLARLDAGEEPLIPWEEAKKQIRTQATSR